MKFFKSRGKCCVGIVIAPLAGTLMIVLRLLIFTAKLVVGISSQKSDNSLIKVIDETNKIIIPLIAYACSSEPAGRKLMDDHKSVNIAKHSQLVKVAGAGVSHRKNMVSNFREAVKICQQAKK